MIHISRGNSKLGGIPSISLSPIASCSREAKCIKDCYALKITQRFKHVREQWAQNLAHYKLSPEGYFEAVRVWLTHNSPDYFRWHVGGDMPDKAYLEQVVELAKFFSSIKFMCFTKQYSLVRGMKLPRNFICRVSAWPYMKLPATGHPVAWIRGDLRRPGNLHHCQGQCDKCLFCWNTRKDVLLKPH